MDIPKRKSDLVTRERATIVLSAGLMQSLRAMSERTMIPVSRLVDKAIKMTYSHEPEFKDKE